MAGTKRSSDGTAATTRSAKVAKKDDGTGSKGKGGKKGLKTNIAASAFLAKALPITVNITNTPPPITDENNVSTTSADPGYIGGVKCLPSHFSTGSYGWKGGKRITIEVPNEAGELEKVQVQVTINATVLGSKNAPEGTADDEAEKKDDEPEAKTAVAEEEAEGEKAEGEKGEGEKTE